MIEIRGLTKRFGRYGRGGQRFVDVVPGRVTDSWVPTGRASPQRARDHGPRLADPAAR